MQYQAPPSTPVAVPPGSGSPNASSQLHSLGPLGDRIEKLARALEKNKALDGARRLMVVSENFTEFTVEGAYDYIKKDEIVQELEENHPWWGLIAFRVLRDVLSIAPIAFTWWALHLAADAYQADLNDKVVGAKDLYQPFLLLWQEGFHGNHGPVIPFSMAAAIDGALLAVLILTFVFLIPWAQKRQRNICYRLLGEDFDANIDALLKEIGGKGANALLHDKDVGKIGEAIKQVMKDFLVDYKRSLNDVLLNYDRVAKEARQFIADTGKETSKVISDFHTDLGDFNANVKLLTTDLQTMDTNLGTHDQRLKDLAEASNKLASSSNDLATNAKDLAMSANQSAVASQSISDKLKDLDATQSKIVQTQQDVADTIKQTQTDTVQAMATHQKDVYKTISDTQKEVVDKITDAQKEVVKELKVAADIVVDSGQFTKEAADGMENVAGELAKLTRTDFQVMTDNIKQSNQDLARELQKSLGEVKRAADEVNNVATNLTRVDAYLSAPTKALQDAAGNISRATASLPQALQQPLSDLASAARALNSLATRLDATLQQPAQDLSRAASSMKDAADRLNQRKFRFWPF